MISLRYYFLGNSLQENVFPTKYIKKLLHFLLELIIAGQSRPAQRVFDRGGCTN
jgi:hypothetical protein